MGYKGGGGDYFGVVGASNGGSPFNANFATQSKAFEPESYFDIVNCSLKGTAGYGYYGYSTGWAMAGNGGPGSGGGACYSGSNNMYVVGGSGGTGGGGGGVAHEASNSRCYGGFGGFGGGGGGVYGTDFSGGGAFGGEGGVGGGGGGGVTHSAAAAGSIVAGNGGAGCVMVFWKG
jgi:hypothetical protein